MTAQKKHPLEGYNAAIEWLYVNRPHMAMYVASLGAPRHDKNCDRAMVVAGADLKPRLYTNDDFLKEIGPAQAAGVLVHEWRHVLLGHFEEVRNPKPHWKYSAVVRDAQEATINDSIELTGYELPADCIRGDNRGGHFYGYWSTDEAYGPMEEWYLSQANPPAQDSTDEDESEGSGDGEATTSSAAGGSNSAETGSGSSEATSEASAGNDGDEANSSAGNAETESSGSAGASSSSGGSEGSEQGSAGAADQDNDTQVADDSQTAADGTVASDSDANSEADNADDSSARADAGGYDCTDLQGLIEGEDGELREMTMEELERFIDNLNKSTANAIKAEAMPEDEKPTEHELDEMNQEVAEAIDSSRSQGYGKAGSQASEVDKILAGNKLHIGWVKLLQKINPRVGKEDGGIQARASYDWSRPRRSTSLIPGAMLPSPGAPRGEGVGAEQKPVALIALDFSLSIDRRLANAMKDMAQSIPSEHIEARCLTFSTYTVPFDYKAQRNSVAGGGTDFSCIHEAAKVIEKETGKYPYVLCLTDGQAWFDYDKPTAEQLDSRWLWVDVLTESDLQAFNNHTAYGIVRRQKNTSALPYDRSKL